MSASRSTVAGLFCALTTLSCLAAEESSPAAAPPAPLRSAGEVREVLERDPRPARYRVEIEGVVLAYRFIEQKPPQGPFNLLFVHDGTSGIYVDAKSHAALNVRRGTAVRVRGTASPGEFAPSIVDAEIEPLGAGRLPEPQRVSIRSALDGALDSQWIEVEGVVRSVSRFDGRMQLQVSDGRDRMRVALTSDPEDVSHASRLENAKVAVRGACGTIFNRQRQILGSVLNAAPEDVRVLESAEADPFAAPARAVKDVLGFSAARWDGRRIKVAGTVAFLDPGRALYLSDPSGALIVATSAAEGAAPGDIVEAVGYPARGAYGGMLEDARFRRVGSAPAPIPLPIQPKDALSGDCEARLVSITARLAGATRGPRGCILVAQAQRHLFSAHLDLRWSDAAAKLPAGSLLKLTGICLTEGEIEFRDRRLRPSGWKLLLRSIDDVAVVSTPPWWTRERLAALLGVAALLGLAAIGWIAALRRRVRSQTAHIARQIERHAVLEERNRIARELHDTLAQGFAGTAFQLEAVAAEFAGGAPSAKRNLDLARQMVRHSLAEARRSVMNLRALGLDGSLFSALRSSADRLIGDASIRLHASEKGKSEGLPEMVRNHLYRIGVEAMTNAVCHGKPSNLWLALECDAQPIRLTVSDDGSGFVESAAAGMHFGLQGMRERARQMNAAIEISSSPGAGTSVRVRVHCAVAAAFSPE